MGQLRQPVMHKHANSIVAPHTLLELSMQARVQSPALRVLRKPPRFPCTEPMLDIVQGELATDAAAPLTPQTYGERYANWMTAVDQVLSNAYLMDPHPERAQRPQTKLVSADH
eukprot:5825909-Amphidinium_carterae.2